MRRYSATEAISPAIDRTREILRAEPRFLFTVKICVCMLIAGFGSLLTFPNMASRRTHFSHTFNGAHAVHQLSLHAAIVLSVIFFLLSIAFFYFGSRLQMVMLNCIATRQTTLAPLWEKYRPVVNRWIGLKLLLSAIPILISVAGIASALKVLHNNPNAGVAAAVLGGSMVMISLLVGLGVYFVYALAKDFVLPPIVLENKSLNDAMNTAMDSLSGQWADVTLYMICKTLIYVLLSITAYVLGLVVTLIAAIPVGIVAFILIFSVRHAGVAGAVLSGFFGICAGAVLGLFALCVMVLAFGAELTFMQAYALYFYGGRYQLLGQVLEPSFTSESFTPPPSFPSDDNSSGPDFPLTPELST